MPYVIRLKVKKRHRENNEGLKKHTYAQARNPLFNDGSQYCFGTHDTPHGCIRSVELSEASTFPTVLEAALAANEINDHLDKTIDPWCHKVRVKYVEREELEPVRAPLTRDDRDSHLLTIWDALHGYREDCITEGDESYDEQWDDIATAMAWIEEDLNGQDEGGSE